MKKTVFAIVLLLLLLMCPITANAADNEIFTRDLSVKNERLFEVEIAFRGDILTAGTFTLTYDAELIDYRDTTTDIKEAEVRADDKSGRTTVIFLCGNGLRTDNTPLLFKVKYKLVGGSDASVRISAGDCTGNEAQQIKSPADTVCNIGLISDESDAPNSRSAVGKHIRSSRGRSSGKSSYVSADEFEYAEDETSKPTVINVESKTDTFGYINHFLLLLAVVAAVLIVLAAMRSDRKEEKDRKS